MQSKKLELVIFSILFVGISILTFCVFQPFFYIIIIAAVLAILFSPLYQKIVKTFSGHKSFAACIIITMILIFLIIPVLFFGLQILDQTNHFFSLTQVDRGLYVQMIELNVNTFGQHIIPNFNFSVSDFFNKIAISISNNLGGLFSQTTYIFLQVFFLLFTTFFFLRDGDKMLETLISFSPFEKEQNKKVVHSVYQTITSVMQGTLLVGLIRFILIAATFYFFGVPDALLWGSIGGIIGLVPGLGTPFVIIPMFLYLVFSGDMFAAVGIVLIGILIAIFIDNMLAAHYFGKGLGVPAFFILFSVLGGVIFFGPFGFIFGPIILSLFISMVDIYKILVLKNS